MAWQQLGFDTRYPDFAEEILLNAGASSVSMIEPEDAAPILEPAPGETPLWTITRVQALFAADADLQPALDALADTLPDGASLRPVTDVIDDRDWVRICLDSMQPMRFGQRLWICPHHASVDADDAIVVRMDPGLAFGTGTHPTTALCLRWLDANPPLGKRVLDYGCGSGILAIAALVLGADTAAGTDIDPQALTATRSNAEDNRVSERLSVVGIDEVPTGPYDLVLANILAGPLVALAPTLLQHLKPGGEIVLAGLLDRQADEVEAAYPDVDWQRESDEGWTRLAGKRRPWTTGLKTESR
jgi:ribosomal protein L11 methyltransferase